MERRPEFRLLRLLGMTRRQVLRMVVWEIAIIVALAWLGLVAGGTTIGLLATVLPALPAARAEP